MRHSDARITLGVYGHVIGDSSVMQWTKWARFCAQVRLNRRCQVSTFNNLRKPGYGFDSRRPLQFSAKFTLIRLPLFTRHPSICVHLTVVLCLFCAQLSQSSWQQSLTSSLDREVTRTPAVADRDGSPTQRPTASTRLPVSALKATERDTAAEVTVKSMYRQAIQEGHVRAAIEIADRVDGRVPLPLVTPEGGNSC